MIQISIPPTAPAPSNSERPNQGPADIDGFEDLLQTQVIEGSTEATPPSVGASKAEVNPSEPREPDDTDDTTAELAAAAALVATPQAETHRSAAEVQGAFFDFEAASADHEGVSPHEDPPLAFSGGAGDGSAHGLPSVAGDEHPATGGKRRIREDAGSVRPSSPTASPVPSFSAPAKEDPPAPSIEPRPAVTPEPFEGAAEETVAQAPTPDPSTKPEPQRHSAHVRPPEHTAVSGGREAQAGGFQQETHSEASNHPPGAKTPRAPRSTAGVEPAPSSRSPLGAVPRLDAASPVAPVSDAAPGVSPSTAVGSSHESRAEALIEQVRIHVKPGQSRIAFRLDPPRLGRLSIRLVMRGGRLLGQVRTESQEAAHLLRSGIEGLRSTMREAGIQVDRLEFQSAPSTHTGTAQSDLRDGSDRADHWSDGSHTARRHRRASRVEMRVEQATLEVPIESDDGRLDVVA